MKVLQLEVKKPILGGDIVLLIVNEMLSDLVLVDKTDELGQLEVKEELVPEGRASVRFETRNSRTI